MGYPYSRNASYTNPSQRSPFSSADQTDNKYQARRSNIPGQNNNYSNVIQNHALKDCQCLVSCTLDHKTITILIDTGSSISLLDEQLYCLLPFVPQLQPIQFSVSGADDRPLIALGITSLSTATDDNIFQVNVLLREISFSLWYWESTSCKYMVELSVFQLTSYTSLPLSHTRQPAYQYQSHLQYIHAPISYHPHPCITVSPNHRIMSLILHQSLIQPEQIP